MSTRNGNKSGLRGSSAGDLSEYVHSFAFVAGLALVYKWWYIGILNNNGYLYIPPIQHGVVYLIPPKNTSVQKTQVWSITAEVVPFVAAADASRAKQTFCFGRLAGRRKSTGEGWTDHRGHGWWFHVFFISTPIPGKMIQFDWRIFFQMGWWKTTNYR